MATLIAPGRRRPFAPAILKAAGCVAILPVVLPMLVAFYLAYPPRLELYQSPADFGLRYADVAFASQADGARLSGWYVPAAEPTGRAVVLVHGFSNGRLIHKRALPLTQALHGAGFDVLLFDMRSHGLSARKPVTFGMMEQGDVAAAVALVRERGAATVALIGYSTGGAASLLAAAADPGIAAVVADSVFTDFDRYLTDRVGPSVARVVLFWYQLLSRYDPEETSPEAVIGQIAPRPVLLIHGEDDRVIPAGQGRALWKAAGNPQAELWIVPGARHTHSYEAGPEAYLSRVVEFLKLP